MAYTRTATRNSRPDPFIQSSTVLQGTDLIPMCPLFTGSTDLNVSPTIIIMRKIKFSQGNFLNINLLTLTHKIPKCKIFTKHKNFYYLSISLFL